MKAAAVPASRVHFTSIQFRNYKSYKNYSVSLKRFNVMVGPNNAGKSTIIGAFRILSEGIRKASKKSAEYIELPDASKWGYRIELAGIPVATENIFYNYDEKDPATVKFRLSNGNALNLYFSDVNECYLFCETSGRDVTRPTEFKRAYGVTIGFVPILGPVEHNEPLYQKEAARNALLTHRASRNFRNIWHHYPEDFDEFRFLINTTWPGMDIEMPEINYTNNPSLLHMFCPEERFPRELFWAGFGFQVWCQMLTFIVKNKDATLLVIDEPDIYLHSDLQRQLIHFLKSLGPDILIATHSTEIISEAEPDDLLIVNKRAQSAKRISDPSQLQNVFGVLGSNLNPTLTQLAKSKRALFVEGKDFQIFSLFARKLGRNQIANRSDFAVVPVEGFNAKKMQDFAQGIELTLGTKIVKAVIFDRDYRSEGEAKEVEKELNKSSLFARIHKRKEIENYLLDPIVLQRAIENRIEDRKTRGGEIIEMTESVESILNGITDQLKIDILGQYLTQRSNYERSKNSSIDRATINSKMLKEFDHIWNDFTMRMVIVPGKQVLSLLNQQLQKKYKITISSGIIISMFKKHEIPEEILSLMDEIDRFRSYLPEAA